MSSFTTLDTEFLGPDLQKDMKMIWLNSKFLYSPAFFFTFGFKDFSTILCNLTNKNGLAAFGCPYQM